MAKEIVANPLNRQLPGGLDKVFLQIAPGRFHQLQTKNQPGDEEDHLRVLSDDDLVDKGLNQPGHCPVRTGGQERAEH